ncbi:MAG: hypothetical protein V1487_04625 [bacterium]
MSYSPARHRRLMNFFLRPHVNQGTEAVKSFFPGAHPEGDSYWFDNQPMTEECVELREALRETAPRLIEMMASEA